MGTHGPRKQFDVLFHTRRRDCGGCFLHPAQQGGIRGRREASNDAARSQLGIVAALMSVCFVFQYNPHFMPYLTGPRE